MLVRIRALAAALGTAILGALLTNPTAGTTALAATSAPEIEAVTGLDSGVWFRSSPGPWLTFPGGGLIAAPAVASFPDTFTSGQGTPFLVATGTDHDLWTVNQLQGWQRL